MAGTASLIKRSENVSHGRGQFAPKANYEVDRRDVGGKQAVVLDRVPYGTRGEDGRDLL